MTDSINQIRIFLSDIAKTAKVRKRLLAVVAVFVVLQLYFVRELIAAELLFGLGFAVLAVVVGILYVVGAIGESAIDATKVGAHVVVNSAHRAYVKASPVVEVAAKRGAVFMAAGAKLLAESARRGYAEFRVIGKRIIDEIQIAARAIAAWAAREYAKAVPVMEVAATRTAVFAEAGAKTLAQSARRGYRKMEEISKKPFRHPRSESAR